MHTFYLAVRRAVSGYVTLKEFVKIDSLMERTEENAREILNKMEHSRALLGPLKATVLRLEEEHSVKSGEHLHFLH